MYSPKHHCVRFINCPIKLFTVNEMKRQIVFLTEYTEGKAFEYRMS